VLLQKVSWAELAKPCLTLLALQAASALLPPLHLLHRLQLQMG
jgi:hypothetical protein